MQQHGCVGTAFQDSSEKKKDASGSLAREKNHTHSHFELDAFKSLWCNLMNLQQPPKRTWAIPVANVSQSHLLHYRPLGGISKLGIEMVVGSFILQLSNLACTWD